MGDEDRVIETVAYRRLGVPYTRGMFWDGAANTTSPTGSVGWVDFAPVRMNRRRLWVGAATGLHRIPRDPPEEPKVPGNPIRDTTRPGLGMTTAEVRTFQQFRNGKPLCETTPVFFTPLGTLVYAHRHHDTTSGPSADPVEATFPAEPRRPFVRYGIGGLDGLPLESCTECKGDVPFVVDHLPERRLDYSLTLTEGDGSSGGTYTGSGIKLFGSCDAKACDDAGFSWTKKFSLDCCPVTCAEDPFPGRNKWNRFFITYSGGHWHDPLNFFCFTFFIFPFFEDPTCPQDADRYGGMIEGGFIHSRIHDLELTPAELALIVPGEFPWCGCTQIAAGRYGPHPDPDDPPIFHDEPEGCDWSSGFGWGNAYNGDACDDIDIGFSSASGFGINGNPDWCWNEDPRDGGGTFRNCPPLNEFGIYPDYSATYNLRTVPQ